MTIRPLNNIGLNPGYQAPVRRPAVRSGQIAETARPDSVEQARRAQSSLLEAQDLVGNVQLGLVRNARFVDSAKANARLVESAVETARDIVSRSGSVFRSAPSASSIRAYKTQAQAELPRGFTEAGEALRSVPATLLALDIATERGVTGSASKLESLSDRLQRAREGLGDGLSRIDTRA